MDRPYIGVIGASQISPEIARIAFEVGKEIGKRNGILVCGGLSGVMEAACRGAKEAGGLTIGILPGFNRNEANPYVDITITTGLLEMRNLIIVRTSDVLIAIAKGLGTLSEIAFALKLEKPVIGIGTWNRSLPVIKARTPKAAVAKAWQLLR
ncbi:MAG: TIGR00725 family protein [candidate division WOR-3 bacterium]